MTVARGTSTSSLPGTRDSRLYTGRRGSRWGQHPENPMARSLQRGRRLGTVHRLLGLRGGVPVPCSRLRPRGRAPRGVPSLSPRRGAARALRARRSRLRHLHARLPPVPRMGTGDRPHAVRKDPLAGRGHRRPPGSRAGSGHRSAHPGGGCRMGAYKRCDYCGRTVNWNDIQERRTWLELHWDVLDDGHPEQVWDFCSWDCAVNFGLSRRPSPAPGSSWSASAGWASIQRSAAGSTMRRRTSRRSGSERSCAPPA